MFLIPIAVVGYKVWENQQQDEEAKKHGRAAQVPEVGEAVLLTASNSEESPTGTRGGSADEFCDNATETSSVSLKAAEENGPFSGMRRFWAVQVRQRATCDPFQIRTNKEALTYEVMGNQGKDALPFPKISYR